MSLLAKLLGAFAVGHSLEHGGSTFTFARVDQQTKVKLEAAYFKRARESVYAMREGLSEEEYDRALSRLTDRYTRGEMGFPLGESLVYFTTNGLAELVAAMTGRPLPDCERLVEERWQETFHLVWCVLCESFEGLKKKLLSAEAQGRGKAYDGAAGLAAQLAMTNGRTPSCGTEPRASPRPESTPTSSPG